MNDIDPSNVPAVAPWDGQDMSAPSDRWVVSLSNHELGIDVEAETANEAVNKVLRWSREARELNKAHGGLFAGRMTWGAVKRYHKEIDGED